MANSSRHPRGFTLIEMVVVMAVLAILAMIALPSYLDRIVREQVAEALPLADLAKPAIAAAWRAKLPLPADNAAAGLPDANKIVNNVVASVAVQEGAIHITFGNKANKALQGKLLSIRPAVVDDTPLVPVTWLCGPAAAPKQMTAKGADLTNIPATLLPLRCR